MDDADILPGSIGLNRDWATFRAQRRVAGGRPIDFRYRGAAKRALNADYLTTRDRLDREYQRDALRGMSGGPSTKRPANGMTISEYAKTKGIGPRKAREIMHGLGILQHEIEVRLVPMITDPSQTKPDYRKTIRLASWAVQADLGRRIHPRKRVPFDVLTEDGIGWLNARWPQQDKPKAKPRGRPTSSLRGEVKALMDEGKSQAEIVRLLGKSRQIVSHHLKALREAA